jgi:hypothetical protein
VTEQVLLADGPPRVWVSLDNLVASWLRMLGDRGDHRSDYVTRRRPLGAPSRPFRGSGIAVLPDFGGELDHIVDSEPWFEDFRVY